MKSNELRKKFLDFFERREHKIVSSSSLIPENDPSVLFTTAGMQQFKPYYLGMPSPFGKNVVSVQKCLRTSDIDEVGDESHLTFFEMLGNFSFGGYFKEEAIKLAYEFITKELNLKIDYVSVFKGEGNIPADTESEKIWAKIDPNIKIVKADKIDNFWGPTGDEGPCGPTTEIYVAGVEIWNIVFNEYYQDKEGVLKSLEIKGVDTGMGLERLLTVIQNKKNVYETDLFNNEETRAERIVADHVKAACFLIADGVMPSNIGRGYILRRLIRRAVRFANKPLSLLVEGVTEIYGSTYKEIQNIRQIQEEIEKEEKKFRQTLDKGLKEFGKIKENISGKTAFDLYQSYGFPLELTSELAREKGFTVDEKGFQEELKKHQDKSRTAMGMFKGGLVDDDPKTIKLHTAHHLLLAALQNVLGKSVKQRGSNVAQERLRIDFSFDRKLTDEEKKKIEEIVNEKIKEGLPVIQKEMKREEADRLGAEMEFGAKYGDTVSIYFIGQEGNLFSKEFCGGPHVSNTSELGVFKIISEEAVAAGVRRIKGVLQ